MTKVERKWIVLVNKVPRGPLTETDIKALLSQKMIRHNDLAFLVSDDAEAKNRKAEWKLLWQFDEFDRRKEPETADKSIIPSPTPVPEPKERREPKSPEQLREKAMEGLPDDILNLSPADLLPKSTGPTQIGANPSALASVRDSEEDKASSIPEFPWGKVSKEKIYFLVGGTLAVILSTIFGLRWLTSRSTTEARHEETRTPVLPEPARGVATPPQKGTSIAPARPIAVAPPQRDEPPPPPPASSVEPTQDFRDREEEEANEPATDELAPYRKNASEPRVRRDDNDNGSPNEEPPPDEEPIDPR